MTIFSKQSQTSGSGWRASLRRLVSDKRGVAAIEFAFIAPILLSMYFVTLEVTLGIEASKKVGRIGSMVADLVTQQQTITKGEIDSVMKIGGALIQPYKRTLPSIIVTAIEITPDPGSKVKVVWSRKLVNGAYSVGAAKDSITTVPTALNTKGSFLIRVESNLAYKPLITWAADQKTTLGLAAAFDGINMADTYYLRPRMSTSIACSDC